MEADQIDAYADQMRKAAKRDEVYQEILDAARMRAREFAENRLFPDEIVCCGPASVLVPYTDPGLLLAREIRTRTEDYMGRYGRPPRVVLLENHGIIALGRTPEAVVAATLTAEKAAQIWIGAATLGGPRVLTAQEVRTIADRGDEHHRQRVLNL